MRLFIYLLILSCAQNIWALELRTFNKRTLTFNNTNCRATDSCHLKKFVLRLNDYRVTMANEYSFGSKLFAFYQTDRVEHLEEFAIVQFIRGCLFSTEKQPNGEIIYATPYHIKSFNEYIPFHFAQWNIDSLDTDPMYSSWDQDEQHTRHYYYMWNEKPWSVRKKTRHNFGGPTPINYPLLYVKDLPGQAMFDGKVAYNTSLQFKTCIYKTKDIPRITDRLDINFATPIHCFEWGSSFIYNHDKQRFESRHELAPYCVNN